MSGPQAATSTPTPLLGSSNAGLCRPLVSEGQQALGVPQSGGRGGRAGAVEQAVREPIRGAQEAGGGAWQSYPESADRLLRRAQAAVHQRNSRQARKLVVGRTKVHPLDLKMRLEVAVEEILGDPAAYGQAFKGRKGRAFPLCRAVSARHGGGYNCFPFHPFLRQPRMAVQCDWNRLEQIDWNKLKH